MIEEGKLSPEKKLFSESTGRFLVTVRPEDRSRFEEILKGLPFALAGAVRSDSRLEITSGGETIVSADIEDLRAAFKKPFGDLT